MHDLQERYSASRAPSRRWIAWMPLLFVSAFLYWSVALGLGGLSLMAAGSLSADVVVTPDLAPTAMEPVPGRVDSIVVHLEESTEPEDVNDNAGNPAVEDTSHDTSDDDGTGMLTGGL
jgi:hypothetical protein